MTAEEKECSVGCEGSDAELAGRGLPRLDSGGDMQGLGGRGGDIVCREDQEEDGDARGDSLVTVNRDSADPVDGGVVDLEEKLETVGAVVADPDAGENDGSAMKKGLITGDQGKGESEESSLEEGQDHEGGVVSVGNSEGKAASDVIRLCGENGMKGELCEDDDYKESRVNSENNGESGKKSGKLCEDESDGELSREKLERELGFENGHDHLEVIDAENESSAMEAEEKEEPQTVATETNSHDKLTSTFEVEDKREDGVDITESNQGAEFESAAQVEEKQEPATVVAEADLQGELESAVILEERVAEAGQQEETESTSEVGEQETKAVFTEANNQGEPKSSVEVAEKQEVEATIAKIEALAESSVTVEEGQHTHTKFTEVDGPEESEAFNVEGKKKIEILLPADNYHNEFESVEVQEKQEAQNSVTETNQRVEPESVGVKEKQQPHTVGETDDQEESESVVLVEENHETEIVAPGTNEHEEFQSAFEVEAKQPQEMVVKEIDGLAELKPAVEVESKHEPENVVAETEVVAAEKKLETETALGDTKGVEPKAERNLGTAVTVGMPFESLIMNELAGTLKGADDVTTYGSSDQPWMVSEGKWEASQEIREVNEPPKSDVEAKSRCLVDGMLSTVEVIDHSLESGESMPTNHADELLECEDKISSFKNSDSPRLCHADEKEMVNEISCSVDNKYVGEFECSRAINDTKLDVCKSIADFDKAVNINRASAMELESEVNDGECMARSVEGDQSTNKDDDEEPACKEVHSSDGIQTPQETSSGSALDGEMSEMYAVKRQPCFMVKIPRFNDNGLKTKLQHARMQLDEKTRTRDSLKIAVQNKKTAFDAYRENFNAAKADERASRAAVSAKRQEIDSVQSMINKMKNASSIDDIDDKIHNIEHILQHETISLPQEKQYIREIKQLRNLREQLFSNMGPQAEIHEAFDQRDQIEERFKTLKKELDSLRVDLLRAERNFQVARQKSNDEFQLLKDLQEQFRVADDLRQEAYGHIKNLKNESVKKSKYFLMYKDDQQAVSNYAFSRNREGLRSHCSEQVETVMELWNNNEEFRKLYVESNVNSTLRRLSTMDGRSLGPDEEPPILQSSYVDRSTRNAPLPISSVRSAVPVLDLEVKDGNVGPMPMPEEVAPPANQAAKSKKSTTSSGAVKDTVPSNEELKEADEEIKRTKEVDELARKADELEREEKELRKERAAAELKEQCRLEQRAKAREAEERKKQKAMKALAKADYRAKKEAEIREKKRAKKEKKKAILADATDGGLEGESAPIVDMVLPEADKEPEITVAPASKRRSSRPPAAIKQYSKIQPLPLPLRDKGKRTMRTWMWVLVLSLLLVLLFFAGDCFSSSTFSLPNLGF